MSSTGPTLLSAEYTVSVRFESRTTFEHLLVFFCSSGVLLGPWQWLGDLTLDLWEPWCEIHPREEPSSELRAKCATGESGGSGVPCVLWCWPQGRVGGQRLLFLEHSFLS